MADASDDPRWPRLLSLSVHELRTPITVVAGYIRMLLKDRAGPLNDQQRRLLEEAEKSCGRLSALVSEMSSLATLEGGTASFARRPVALNAVLTESIAELPELADRQVSIDLSSRDAGATVTGDADRLKAAFSAMLGALRRELVTSSTLFVRQSTRNHDGGRIAWVAFGDAELVEQLDSADPSSLTTFDEWRGGSGLSLAIARRVFGPHAGRVWSPGQEAKAGAVVQLPLS